MDDLTKFFDEFALFDAIEQKNHKRFRSLITQPDFNIDHVDRNGRSLLMHLTTIPHGYKFVQQLLHRGANVNLKDNFGYTFLHLAIRATRVNNLKMGELIIEHGADVNCQDRTGITPMYMACLEGNVKWIYMLLYYGADPNIASNDGLLPMSVLPQRLSDYEFLLEIFFQYALDCDKLTISLPTLAAAMWRDSSLFSKISETSPHITCDLEDIKYFCTYFFDVKSKHFQMFINKFGYVLEHIIDETDFLHVIIEARTSMELPENWKMLNSLLESKYVSKLIYNTDPAVGFISHLIKEFAAYETKETFVSRIFLILSYGLTVTLQDLQTAFNYSRDLFEILLHMDVVPIHEEVSSIVRLCYDPKLTLEDCLGDSSVDCLLSYFNSPKLKELCLATSKEDIVERVRQMSSVPSLIELSRNIVKPYIVERYKIVSCKQLHAVLNGLPIDRITKRMISLEQKIY